MVSNTAVDDEPPKEYKQLKYYLYPRISLN
jgi:hypothetical protein